MDRSTLLNNKAGKPPLCHDVLHVACCGLHVVGCMCISLLHAQGSLTLTLTLNATSMPLMHGLLCRPRRLTRFLVSSRLERNNVGPSVEILPIPPLNRLTRQRERKSHLAVNTKLLPTVSPDRLRRDLPRILPEG